VKDRVRFAEDRIIGLISPAAVGGFPHQQGLGAVRIFRNASLKPGIPWKMNILDDPASLLTFPLPFAGLSPSFTYCSLF